jgi:tetratricopeptide (TPR) repeat protein
MTACTIVRASALAERYQLRHLWTFSTGLEREPDLCVTLHETNVTFDSLNLDAPKQFDASCQVHVFLGDLTVTGTISNENTDGANCLIVLGDLHAKNIAIGGQETYVRGNVHVEEVLCGSYNHGEMKVDGDVTAKLLISDDYRFWIKGTLNAPIAFTDCDRVGMLEGRDFDPDYDYENDASGIGYGGARWLDAYVPISYALIDDCWDDTEADAPLLFGMLEMIVRSGRSALKQEFLTTPPDFSKLRDASSFFSKGCRALDDDDNSHAAELFLQALEAGFPPLQTHDKLASAIYDLGEYERVLRHFDICIEASYMEAECRVKRASSLIELDQPDHDKAWEDCEWVVQNSDLYNDDEWLTDAFNIQGVSLRERGRQEEAIPYFHKALAEDEDDENALGNLAKSLWLLGREAEAMPYAQKAMDLYPSPRFTLYVKAKCHLAQGELDAAIDDFLAYAEYHPEFIHAWLYLAEIYDVQGKRADAKEAAQKALKIDAGNETATEILKQLDHLKELS